MTVSLRSLILLALMLLACSLAVALRPNHKIADHLPPLNLDLEIPKQFGTWTLDEKDTYIQVSPDETAAIKKIYTSVLTRTYTNNEGYRIMLSIPYGKNQSDGLSAHDPEGCYPGQGFQILSKNKTVIPVSGATIPIRRLETERGSRHEPVTYWFTVGEYAVNNDWDRKKAQLHYALKGQIPDGLLVRVSSIDNNNKRAYAKQQFFIEELVSAISSLYRTRIIGVNLTATTSYSDAALSRSSPLTTFLGTR